jgi:hypothetical protein
MTLLAPAERAERAAAKRTAALRFLRTNVYTAPEVLMALLSTSARQVIQRLMSSMQREDLIRSEQVVMASGRQLTLYGITQRGQMLAADIQAGEAISDKVFEPGRVSYSVLQHTIDIQLLQIQAERAGWRDWQLGDRLEKWSAGQGRPDVIATHPSGARWALECERTIKTRKRYAAILSDRLQAIRRGDVARVVWLTPTADEAIRLAHLIKSIPSVVAGGQSAVIDPARHHVNIDFYPYDALPTL